MYDFIILGATFAAAGIASQLKERCLVIERRAQAGYEFFGALDFSVDESEIYNHFQCNHILFCTETVSVEEVEGGFACTTHGVQGFCTYYAKKVIDTRTEAEKSLSKTYNLLIESAEEPNFPDIRWKKTKRENTYILYCPVPLFCSYAKAREAAQNTIRYFSEAQRLILSANEFDYRLEEGVRETRDGVLYLPSKAYRDPRAAFEAGLAVGKEAEK